MPRPSKGPRLYLRKPKGQEAVYVIRDGQKEVSTGCAATDVDGASQALRDYLSDNFRPDTGERSLNKIGCAEVLMLYLTDLPADSPTRKTIGHHMKPLNAFWGDKSLADVKGSTCREYVYQRTGQGRLSAGPASSVKQSTARQELKTFQAAINHWHRESPLAAVPKVTLPKPGSRRERVLERSEVARMLWACRKLSRTGHKAAKGAVQYTDYSHVARFIIIGIYTGTRHEALVGLRWSPHPIGGHIDLARAVLYRRGTDERETSKRRPPVSISPRLLPFVRRWRREHQDDPSRAPVIAHKGIRILKMRRAWNTVRKAAGLGSDVTPHVLRHTCVSWLLWGREGRGARPATKPLTIWEVAGIVGADASTIEKVYGHHRRVE